MDGKDIECEGFTFVSNFDSGNLARVEFVPKQQIDNTNQGIVRKSNNNHGKDKLLNGNGKNLPVEEVPDFEFNIWTKPDCAGTKYENSNRTWFYFGVKGGAPFALVKLNIVDLNKQTKMYSQGMAPVYRMVPGRHHWERIRDKPVYVIEENIFTLSFKYRTLENLRATTYFAFTYPYTYGDVQNALSSIDSRFWPLERSPFSAKNMDDIYYHRECVCYSLEGRRIDLITISSYHNITDVQETRLKNLFPEADVPRPFRFADKKIVFLSARVHPGETPSSFVLNGLLNLLLMKEDPISIVLRRMYVFKLIPVLNPDGVANGHYRTDTRGVNLNRVYLNPSFLLHPSVYAARALIRYYHLGKEVEENLPEISDDQPMNDSCQLSTDNGYVTLLEGPESSAESVSPLPCDSLEGIIDNIDGEMNRISKLECLIDNIEGEMNRISNIATQVTSLSLDDKQHESETLGNEQFTNNKCKSIFSSPRGSEKKCNVFSTIHETLVRSIRKNDDKNLAAFPISVIGSLSDEPLVIGRMVEDAKKSSPNNEPNEEETPNLLHLSEEIKPDKELELKTEKPELILEKNSENITSIYEEAHTFKEICSDQCCATVTCAETNETEVDPENSGLFLYVDLHGHASKKGIFMYGNYFDNIVDSVECMLLPKIMSLNSPNFHFTACNFTEKNMYLRDRRDGTSREGSGRVAVLKATGLVRSYTLECNYNTGRVVNILPPCLKEFSKPIPLHLVPPKYCPQVFEEVGRALGISILDLTGSNPCSRIPNSEFHTLSGIREWLKSNCVPELQYSQKVFRNQRQTKYTSNAAQVACTAGARPIRPSSGSPVRKGRLNASRQEHNLARNRRLAPLMSKAQESKLNRIKIHGNNAIAMLCNTNKIVSENVEDLERKENMSSFQIMSPSHSPLNSRLTKVFSGPKENIGPASSRKCRSTSRKYKGKPSTSSGVLKQVLPVRPKYAAVASLSGSSKAKGNGTMRMQRVSSVGPINLQRKDMATSCEHHVKCNTADVVKSHESGLAVCSYVDSYDKTEVFDLETECVDKSISRTGSFVLARASSSNDKSKFNKDETRSDQVIVKQGSKRLKISRKSDQLTTSASVPNNFQHANGVVGVTKMKLKDLCFINIVREKGLAKSTPLPEHLDLSNNIDPEPITTDGIIISWEPERKSDILSYGSLRQNSTNMKSTISQRKLNKVPLPLPSTVGASNLEFQGSTNKIKAKHSTKSDKQGKGNGPLLSPLKTLKKASFGKKTNSELGKKRVTISLGNLTSSVSKFRTSSSGEAHQGFCMEKKRKKSKSKFI